MTSIKRPKKLQEQETKSLVRKVGSKKPLSLSLKKRKKSKSEPEYFLRRLETRHVLRTRSKVERKSQLESPVQIQSKKKEKREKKEKRRKPEIEQSLAQSETKDVSKFNKRKEKISNGEGIRRLRNKQAPPKNLKRKASNSLAKNSAKRTTLSLKPKRQLVQKKLKQNKIRQRRKPQKRELLSSSPQKRELLSSSPKLEESQVKSLSEKEIHFIDQLLKHSISIPDLVDSLEFVKRWYDQQEEIVQFLWHHGNKMWTLLLSEEHKNQALLTTALVFRVFYSGWNEAKNLELKLNKENELELESPEKQKEQKEEEKEKKDLEERKSATSVITQTEKQETKQDDKKSSEPNIRRALLKNLEDKFSSLTTSSGFFLRDILNDQGFIDFEKVEKEKTSLRYWVKLLLLADMSVTLENHQNYMLRHYSEWKNYLCKIKCGISNMEDRIEKQLEQLQQRYPYNKGTEGPPSCAS